MVVEGIEVITTVRSIRLCGPIVNPFRATLSTVSANYVITTAR